MPIRTATIAGSGPEAVNMAESMMHAGISVTLWDNDTAALERALHFLKNVRGAPVRAVTDFGAANRADLIVDALQASPQTRFEFFGYLTDIPADQMVLVTGPALIKEPDHMPAGSGNRFVGFHVVQPGQMRTLVEISADRTVPPVLVSEALSLVRVMGKVAIVAPFGRASIATRLMDRLQEAADMMLLRGAIPHEVDEALVAFGFDVGPFQAQDLTGLDIARGDSRRQTTRRDPTTRHFLVSDRMVQEGRLGKKVGVGWYRYPGGGGAVIDPLIEDLINEEARFARIRQRPFGATEILHRILMALIHESAGLLEDGTTTSAADIDTVSVCGLGFPAHMGGIVHYADGQGAGSVQAHLAKLAEDEPDAWVSRLAISDCARKNAKLSRWTRP